MTPGKGVVVAARPGALPRATEAEWQKTIITAARLHGWRHHHTWLSVRSDPGWPDLVLLRPRDGRQLVVELKSDRGRITPAQQAWLDDFAACGVPAYVWRPGDDWEAITAVLRGENDDA